jgi:hypothetical protein
MSPPCDLASAILGVRQDSKSSTSRGGFKMLVLSGDWAEIAGYFDVQKIADSSCRLGADTRPQLSESEVLTRAAGAGWVVAGQSSSTRLLPLFDMDYLTR